MPAASAAMIVGARECRRSSAPTAIVALGLLGLSMVAAVAPVRAQDALTPLDTTATAATLDRRIRFIEQRLDGSRTHAQIWYWSWMSIDVGSMVWLGVNAGRADHEDDAVNDAVNAGLGAIGIADLLLRPLEARYGAEPIAGMPEATREEKIAKLRAAEDLLRNNAARSEERVSLALHAGNVALNGAAGLIVGLAGRPSDGLITFVSGTLGGVVNLLTAPWAPDRDWQDYKAMIDGSSRRTSVDLALSPLADGARLALRLQW